MTAGSEQRASAGRHHDPAPAVQPAAGPASAGRGSVTPGVDDVTPGVDDAAAYLALQQSPEFQDLRRRLRRFVFPMTGVFLGWYLLYVLLADYAHDLMATRVIGNITVGLVFGLLQFVSTFVITGLYVRYAGRVIDPRADRLRAEWEDAR